MVRLAPAGFFGLSLNMLIPEGFLMERTDSLELMSTLK
jgi:hypothetical protein